MKEKIIDLIYKGADGLVWLVEAIDKAILQCKSLYIEFTLYDLLVSLVVAFAIYVVGKKLVKAILAIKYRKSRGKLEARLGIKHRLAIDTSLSKQHRFRFKSKKVKKDLEEMAERTTELLNSETPEERQEKRKLSFDERMQNRKNKSA